MKVLNDLFDYLERIVGIHLTLVLIYIIAWLIAYGTGKLIEAVLQ